MTVIIGLIDTKLNKAYIGSDGVIQIGTIVAEKNKNKIFRLNDSILIGFSGDLIISDTIKANADNLIIGIEINDPKFSYKFRKNLIRILKEEEIKPESGHCYSMSAIILYENKLFCLSGDTSVIPTNTLHNDRYLLCACGLGYAWIRSFLFGVMSTDFKITLDTIKKSILHCGEHYPEMGACSKDDITCYEIDL